MYQHCRAGSRRVLLFGLFSALVIARGPGDCRPAVRDCPVAANPNYSSLNAFNTFFAHTAPSLSQKAIETGNRRRDRYSPPVPGIMKYHSVFRPCGAYRAPGAGPDKSRERLAVDSKGRPGYYTATRAR